MRAGLWIISVLVLGLYITGPVFDPDLWWHIVVGRWILAKQQFPVVDHWNLFGAGKPWFAYSWSSEVLFATLDSTFGFRGLVFGQSFFGTLVAGTFAYTFSKIAKNYFIGLLFGAACTLTCIGHFALRPQTLTWCLLAAALFISHDTLEKGVTKGGLLKIFLLFALWANTHITTGLGLFAIGAWAYSGRDSIRDVALLLGVGFLGSLCTPYLGSEWLTFIAKSGHPISHSTIIEFGPANILQYSTAFLGLLVVLYLAFLWGRSVLVRPGEVLVIAVFTVGSLAVVKFLPYAAIVICASLCSVWARSGSLSFPLRESFERMWWLSERLIGKGLVFVATVLVVLHVERISRLGLHDNLNNLTPHGAVDYVVRNGLPLPLLNAFGEGGFILYKTSNENGEIVNPVTIDGRTNVNPPLVSDLHYLANNGLEGWQSYIDLVQPNTILWKNRSPFVSLLEASGEWCRVYRDGDKSVGYSVFVRMARLGGDCGGAAPPRQPM
jgi:hypothetical protein